MAHKNWLPAAANLSSHVFENPSSRRRAPPALLVEITSSHQICPDGLGLGFAALSGKTVWQLEGPFAAFDPLSECRDNRPIVQLTNGTLPDRGDTPATCAKCAYCSLISGDISRKLFPPEGGIRARHRCGPAVRMLVPEAAVDEDGHAVLRKDQIGPARQAAAMQAKPVSGDMQRRPDADLRLRVLSPDPRHHAGSG